MTSIQKSKMTDWRKMFEYQKNYLKMIIEQNGECKYIDCHSCPIKSSLNLCREKVAKELKIDYADVRDEHYVQFAKLILSLEENKNE